MRWYFWIILLGVVFVGSVYALRYLRQPTVTTTDAILEEKAPPEYYCVVPEAYCEFGEEVYMDGEYLGVGYELPVGTPIKAAVDSVSFNIGSYSFYKDGEVISNAIVTHRSDDIEVMYVLGERTKKQTGGAKQGEEFENISVEKLDGFENYNLIVIWKEIEGDILYVDPEDLK